MPPLPHSLVPYRGAWPVLAGPVFLKKKLEKLDSRVASFAEVAAEDEGGNDKILILFIRKKE